MGFFEALTQVGRAAAWLSWGALVAYAALRVWGVHVPGLGVSGL